MYNRTGTIFNIQRFSTSDGPGIRTTVFFKGCPLNCAWCHNPESKSALPEVFYKKDLCISCRACGEVCPQSCHSFTNEHIFDRKSCTACARCVQVCPSDALEGCGEVSPVSRIIETVLRDKPFYDETGGGLTLSGGEPLMQPEFCVALLQCAKQHGIHTAVQTSGFSADGISIDEINRFTDLWLYDIKLFPDSEHIKYTGVSNKIILKNLRRLDTSAAAIILRCPLIPGINITREHFEKIAELLKELKNVRCVNLLPYHPLGISKAQQLSKAQKYQNDSFAELPPINTLADMLRAKTDIDVVI